jgi:hypothetical protein
MLISIVTAQAIHAWRTNQQEGVEGGNAAPAAPGGGSGSGSGCPECPAPPDPTACAPGDLSCQVQQQAERISRLQAAVQKLTTTASQALADATKANNAVAQIGAAKKAEFQAKQQKLAAQAAPIQGLGSPPLAAPPASKAAMSANMPPGTPSSASGSS